MKRLFQLILLVVLVVAVLLDLQEAVGIYKWGFPPFHVGEAAAPTTRDQLEYGLYLAILGGLQVAIVTVLARSWRGRA